MLFSKKRPPSKKDEEEGVNGEQIGTRLREAASNGNHEECKTILEQGISGLIINSSNDQGQTALHLSAMNGHLNVVELLVNQGADYNFQDQSRATPFHKAAASKNEDVIYFLIRQADVKVGTTNADNNTPLHFLAKNPSETPTHLKEILAILIEKGANINTCNINGETPLHFACLKKNIPMLELLVHYKANLDQRNDHGETPLHWSARLGHTRCVAMLLLAGADPTLEGMDGSPYDVSAPVADIRAMLQNELLPEEYLTQNPLPLSSPPASPRIIHPPVATSPPKVKEEKMLFALLNSILPTKKNISKSVNGNITSKQSNNNNNRTPPDEHIKVLVKSASNSLPERPCQPDNTWRVVTREGRKRSFSQKDFLGGPYRVEKSLQDDLNTETGLRKSSGSDQSPLAEMVPKRKSTMITSIIRPETTSRLKFELVFHSKTVQGKVATELILNDQNWEVFLRQGTMALGLEPSVSTKPQSQGALSHHISEFFHTGESNSGLVTFLSERVGGTEKQYMMHLHENYHCTMKVLEIPYWSASEIQNSLVNQERFKEALRCKNQWHTEEKIMKLTEQLERVKLESNPFLEGELKKIIITLRSKQLPPEDIATWLSKKDSHMTLDQMKKKLLDTIGSQKASPFLIAFEHVSLLELAKVDIQAAERMRCTAKQMMKDLLCQYDNQYRRQQEISRIKKDAEITKKQRDNAIMKVAEKARQIKQEEAKNLVELARKIEEEEKMMEKNKEKGTNSPVVHSPAKGKEGNLESDESDLERLHAVEVIQKTQLLEKCEKKRLLEKIQRDRSETH